MSRSDLLSYSPSIRDSPVGQLILNFDWTSTPLGPIERWPQSLKTIVALIQENPMQSCILWGDERTVIYNNAFAHYAVSKHPGAMGQPGRIAFREVWDVFSQHCSEVYSGKSIGRVDDPLFFEYKFTREENTQTTMSSRYPAGSPQLRETYYTWTYLPIIAEENKIGGILQYHEETTEKVLRERRMRTVWELSQNTAAAQTTSGLWKTVADTLKTNEHDFPYFMCYSVLLDISDTDTTSAISTTSKSSLSLAPHLQLTLMEACGVVPGHRAAPEKVDIFLGQSYTDGESETWPFLQACTGRTPLRASNPCPEDFDAGRSWGDIPGDAVLIPLTGQDDALIGLVVFGLNTRRKYDEAYAVFYQTLLRNLSASLLATRAFEREVHRMEEMRALDRAKTVFFQNVSHELRTPLTLIRGPCDDALKAGDAVDPASRSRFKLIYRASGRLLRLVNSLLLFSSAEAKRLSAVFRPVRVGQVTAELASLFRSSIEKAGILFNVSCGEPDDNHEIYLDLSMWEKIVFNLLSNAVKYTSEGFINLNVGFTHSDMVLRVDDSGCGIPDDQRDLILQRFHRVEDARGRSHEGTGIGLALTLELVRLHGGSISVESVLGQGSTFIVRIPRGYAHLPQKDVINEHSEAPYGSRASGTGYGSYAEDIVEEANTWLCEDSDTVSSYSLSSGPPESAVGRGPEPFCILLAEDNADARQYVKSILSTMVKFVVPVKDGQEALDYVRHQLRPDLIITDIMMPRLTGTELIQALANDSDPRVQNIPVIVLTARTGSENDTQPETLLHGSVDFLLKPFSSTDLIRRVRARLDTIQQKQVLERQIEQRTFELDQAHQRYQRISELAPVAMFETDDVERGLITFANERFFTLTGLPRSLPMQFREVLELIHSDTQPTVERIWSKILETGSEKPAKFDFEFLNGQHATAEMVVLSSGAILGTLTDQTEQRLFAHRQLEAERKKADEAVHQRRLQEAFIDIVSHELRNPLSAILQSVDLLTGSLMRLGSIIQELFTSTGRYNPGHGSLKNLIEESRVELDDAIHAVSSVELCARHQSIIASDILVVSRLDSNLLSINPTTFHLLSELQNTLAMFSVQAERQSIKFDFEPSPDITPETRIAADPTRLRQILVNLIANSCRILELWSGKRKIILEASISRTHPLSVPDRHNDAIADSFEESRIWLVFNLSDTGPGIPVDDLPRLFTRFNDVHVDGTHHSSVGGTGLGLYLCRKLAELQGGAIQCHADSGKGAAFFFFIEARLEENAPNVLTPYSQRNRRFRAMSTNTNSGPSLTRLSADFLLKAECLPLPIPIITDPAWNKQEARPKSPKDYFSLRMTSGEISPLVQSSLVLIVEDNDINQKLLRRQIEKAGFAASTANNGLEALQYLEGVVSPPGYIYPSVILMDLEMPILGGLEATTRIRMMEKDGRLPAIKPLPIYAITGNARQGQIEAALEVGMNQVYIKPYNIKEIVAKIYEEVGR